MNLKKVISSGMKKIDRLISDFVGWFLIIAFLFAWTMKVFVEFFPFILILSLPFVILFDIWIGFFYIYYGIMLVLCGYRAFCEIMNNHQF